MPDNRGEDDDRLPVRDAGRARVRHSHGRGRWADVRPRREEVRDRPGGAGRLRYAGRGVRPGGRGHLRRVPLLPAGRLHEGRRGQDRGELGSVQGGSPVPARAFPFEVLRVRDDGRHLVEGEVDGDRGEDPSRGYVSFTDQDFMAEPFLVRFQSVKKFINRPHSPEIQLNSPSRA